MNNLYFPRQDGDMDILQIPCNLKSNYPLSRAATDGKDSLISVTDL